MNTEKMNLPTEPLALFWFRRDLRLEDNHALYRALASGHKVMAIFIFDQNILRPLSGGHDPRVQFIHQELSSLKNELRTSGSDLSVFYGDPLEVISALGEQMDVQALYANRDYEPYAQKRDESIYRHLEKNGIPFKGYKDHVVFDRSEVVKKDGSPYTVFSPYMRKWKEHLKEHPISHWPSSEHLHQLLPMEPQPMISLEEMEFVPQARKFPERITQQKLLKDYHNTRDIPSVQGTSRLSLHLRFGTISIRHCALLGEKHNEKWLNELIWRDFYQMILYHFPRSVDQAFKPAYDAIEWEENETHFNAWCEGRTGYPLVDAGMRELNATGFMHNRVRMVTASFLTKHLLIDWKRGERYFAAKLLDFELASNVGGWQWASSSGCDAAPYFRVFNPHLQLQKFDPELKYVKTWIPEWGTEQYPEPIVDHKMARERVLSRYQKALKK